MLEETTPVIEMQLLDRRRVRGKATGAVPEAGELLPEIVERVLPGFIGIAGRDGGRGTGAEGAPPDALRRLPPPVELLRHPEGRARRDLPERHRLLHAGAEPGRGRHGPVHGGRDRPGRRVPPCVPPFRKGGRHRGDDRRLHLLPRRRPRADRRGGPGRAVRPGHPRQLHDGHDRVPAHPRDRQGSRRGADGGRRHGSARPRLRRRVLQGRRSRAVSRNSSSFSRRPSRTPGKRGGRRHRQGALRDVARAPAGRRRHRPSPSSRRTAPGAGIA